MVEAGALNECGSYNDFSHNGFISVKYGLDGKVHFKYLCRNFEWQWAEIK